ncbi:hypothetical protein PN836_006710 [Ningiella sp. W23]|uniref:hypothetical protein n=1 Tax=Ningiella sp. W23 TaxID=3023715 RepID=UPI0037563C4D
MMFDTINRFNKSSRVIIISTVCLAAVFSSAPVYAQTKSACLSGSSNLLVNGSFEESANSRYNNAFDMISDLGRENSGVYFLDAHPQIDFPAWFTTGGISLQQGGISKGGEIEVGQSGFLGINAYHGRVFVEMDGNHHEQIVMVEPNKTFEWELAHRGRQGVDTIAFSVKYDDGFKEIAQVSTGKSGWQVHRGSFSPPKNETKLHVRITPLVASNGDIDSSNFLDDVKLCYKK